MMNSNDAGFTEAASIIFWNSGRRSSVAEAPGSTNSATTEIPFDAQ